MAAKSITRASYGKPTLALSLVSGGTLDANTTYHVRVVTSHHTQLNSTDYCSEPSDPQTITTDSVNRSIRLDIVHSTGAAEYTYVWIAKGAAPSGIDGWNNQTTGLYTLYAICNPLTVNGNSVGKVTTYTITSSTYFQTSQAYRPFLLDHAQDRLYLYGGSEADPWTLGQVYEYVVAQGWPTASTIQVLKKLHPTGYRAAIFSIAAKQFSIQADCYLVIEECVVDLEGLFTSAGWVRIGQKNALTGSTSHGATFRCYAENGYPATSIGLGGVAAYLYDSTFQRAISGMYNTFNIGAAIYEIIDCVVSAGWDRGLGLSSPATSGLLRRVRMGTNRWEMNTTNLLRVTFEDIQFDMTTQSGPWFRVIYSGTPVEETWISNLKFTHPPGPTFYLMYLTGALTGQISMVNLLNPSDADWGLVRWYLPVPGNVAFLKLWYTVEVRVTDETGQPISGATVTLTGSDGAVAFTATTDANGEIGEQRALSKRLTSGEKTATGYHQDAPAGLTETFTPFVLEIDAGDLYEPYSDIVEVTSARSLQVSMTPTVFGVLIDAGSLELARDAELTLSPDAELTLEADLDLVLSDDADVSIAATADDDLEAGT